jgi:hypothetical protein
MDEAAMSNGISFLHGKAFCICILIQGKLIEAGGLLLSLAEKGQHSHLGKVPFTYSMPAYLA